MKNNRLTVVLCVILWTISSFAQRIGVVMSGGGAKGIAHIGMLQALEENDIPIDYVTGTSMGAIVGGLYAIGYSPQDMLKLVMSEDFIKWQTGTVEIKDLAFYKRGEPTSEFLNFKVGLHSTQSIGKKLLPTSIINPIQLNLQFIPLFAQATAASGGDFDRLFVPFRCISSDVLHRVAIEHKSGDLGDAIRGSMSIPFVFKPIQQDSIPLYDGGIFDNFPIKSMKKDFNPDYVIGSVVANMNRRVPDEGDLFGQFELLFMEKTDYSLLDIPGVIYTYELSNYGMLDFDKAQEIYNIGYQKGMEYVEQIKSATSRRVPAEELAARREHWKDMLPPLEFKKVIVEGVDNDQKAYIRSKFGASEKEKINFEKVRFTYFNLLSDNTISEILPHAVYDKEKNAFDLEVNVKLNDKIRIGVGGNISSTSSSQLFLGIGYQHMSRVLSDHNAQIYFGQSYNSFALSSRVIFPYKLPIYVTSQLVISGDNLFDRKWHFISESQQPYTYQSEFFWRLSVGIPTSLSSKAEAFVGLGRLTDKYAQFFYADQFSRNISNLINMGLRYEQNTLNTIIYPTMGQEICAKAIFVTGNTKYYQQIDQTTPPEVWHLGYPELSFRYKQFFPFSKRFVLGVTADAVYAYKPLLSTYSESVTQAATFAPTPHSQMTFIEQFRSNEFIAAGLLPIFRYNNFQWRNEFYLMLPYRSINRMSYDPYSSLEYITPIYAEPLKQAYGMIETSLIYGSQIGAVSIFANYYTWPKNNFNFGVNIGIPLKNLKFMQ